MHPPHDRASTSPSTSRVSFDANSFSNKKNVTFAPDGFTVRESRS